MNPVSRLTTRHRFDDQLDAVRTDLLSMGFETEEMVRDSIQALTGEWDGNDEIPDIAGNIVLRDDHVDVVETEIEGACVQILALQQPVLASDLRLIMAMIKTANNVERIGDHAVNIAKTVRRMAGDGIWYRPIVDIGCLGSMARRMLHDALEAIVHNDVALARSVIEADDAVDQLYARMRRDLQSAMETDPTVVRLASSLLFVIHYLERVSDRSTNIAELLLSLETGIPPELPHKSAKSKPASFHRALAPLSTSPPLTKLVV